ncbi:MULTISPECIES: NAD(P)/FAD-dependent oxidoreductase [Paraburkholderia]|uniref:flavin-containing monooxygenase n=1 Tax=Paraburkholderia TaxID=1822464 RepID=UPI00224EEB46|nr:MULTISPECIES: NAD(P)/FAD-dependent oxidoreductase [Paraburkholderia]MCX4161821.1 NAD(P)/FAD-dependent oxidoreductase [Paraburkholderia megapolitana]MDN7157318.1 NAD(P)/FAD-dependent oxidoreductase [Paraburkholderia sp. CHISQ3]MDQ6494363.1 NAD(P)/FAD-dependent oxidoreductase [Paraburkholderia megapolitana]
MTPATLERTASSQDQRQRAARTTSSETDYDVLIVGAGLSGVAAAHYLQTQCPSARFTILESRQTMGGTWDLFRYPGVRSDSDMFTLGYSFRPWAGDKAITEGGLILDYIKDTAHALGIDSSIRFGHRVVGADWNSSEARWTVRVQRSDATGTSAADEIRYTCSFLYMCSGYYDYEEGHAPRWADMEKFAGRVVHPQHWPDDLAYAGKRVVVIGSGATAVTLVPAMAPEAAHVTMLQRSPTYILSLPARDAIADKLRSWLPAKLAHRLVRTKNVLLTTYLYHRSRRKPEETKRLLIKAAARQLGPDFDVATHMTPKYNPWDQRLCLVPNGDLFKTVRSGSASIVTDEIERFTETGLQLRSGKHLDADIVVSATGLKVKMLGGATVSIDGRPVSLSDTVSYKGMMYSGIPNLASSFGYTNASWTLKAELIAQYVCRLINHMKSHGYDSCVPRLPDDEAGALPAVDLTSGYIQRAANILPRQGLHKPWNNPQSYLRDLASLKFGTLSDGAMQFERREQPATVLEQTAQVQS